MDRQTSDRPWFHDRGELGGYDPLKTPIWIFDVDRHAMWWANPSGLAFWRAESLESLIARDFSSDSDIVRTRLRRIVESPSGPSRIQEAWTLYPHDNPTTVIVDIRPIFIDDGRHAVLIEASYPLDLQGDPEALRILEAARSSPLLVSSFSLEGRLLARNPAAAVRYPRTSGSIATGDLDRRFPDRPVTGEIVAAIEKTGTFEADLSAATAVGARIHRVTARKGRDPVSGTFVIVLTEEDITERTALQTGLASLNEELERRVEERTVELRRANDALTREIAERQAMEETLRAREAHIAQAQVMAKIGVFIWDNVTDVAIYYSKGLAGLLGMTDDEMKKWGASHESTLQQVEPRDRAHYHRVIRHSEKNIAAYDVEYRIRDADGNPRYWREMGEPITDDAGNLIRTFGTIQDITEIKRAEAQLRQAQKMEAVGQLTGGVAHDFNNLLAVIQGNAEMILDDWPEGGDALPAIMRATRRGAELTQRLLAFSRQQPLRPKSIDLADLANNMEGLLKRTLGETVEVQTVAKPNLWTASADPGQVENALLNLAINARDAMPEGGKLIIECANVRLDEDYVKRNPEARTGDYVVMSVTDSGTGMSPEVREHAFEPFFTTKEVGQGSGLGLSMVYGFAKQSGGQVSIYSEEGRGTTVKLYLPRDEAPRREVEKPGASDLPRGDGETVLVIEDDPDVRKLAVMMLESLGYGAIEVSETASALAVLARGDKIDLVLSDVVLPGGRSGPDFAEEAKTRYPDLKVIFMSGYPAEAAKRNGFLGSDKVLLNKPFQRRQLARVLREALA